MKSTLKMWFFCFVMKSHAWTSMAMEFQGKVPPHLQPGVTDSPEVTMRKFKAYARMYCKRCDKTSKLSV